VIVSYVVKRNLIFAIDVWYQNIFRKNWEILLSCTFSMMFYFIALIQKE